MSRFLWIFLILCMIVLVSGCTDSNQVNNNQNANGYNKYVAVREIMRVNDTVISGYYPYQKYVIPDSLYWYNKSIKPYPTRSVPNPDKIKIILTTFEYTDTPTGIQVIEGDGGAIYKLPYTLQTGLVITGVDENGTLELLFNIWSNNRIPQLPGNISISIPPGESWTSPPMSVWNETESTSVPPLNMRWNPDMMIYNYTVQHAFSCTIENQGVFD